MRQASRRSCASIRERTSIRSTPRRAAWINCAFFDHWLKGIDTGIMDEPPVKLQIRTGGGLKDYKFRFENEWPIARTRWTRMYLRAEQPEQNHDGSPEGALLSDPVTDETAITYLASPPSHAGSASAAPSVNAGSIGRTGVSFRHRSGGTPRSPAPWRW